MRFKRISMEWLRPMLIIVIAILTVCSFLCVYMINSLQKNLLQMNRHLTGYVQQSVDSRLLELQKYALLLELSPTNANIKTLDTAPERISAAAYQFGDQMRNYKLVNKLVDGVFIYYPAIRQVVGEAGCYASTSYYRLKNELSMQGYDKWIQALSDETKGNLLSVPLRNTTQLCYVRRMQYEGQLRGIAVLEIDANELLRSSVGQQRERDSFSALGILLGGEFVSTAGNQELLQGLDSMQGGMDNAPQSYEDNDRYVFVQPSELPGLAYVNVYSHQNMFAPIRLALKICVASIAFCLFFGVISSIYISRKNSMPLEKLLNKVADGGTPEEDAYQFIGNHIDQLLNEKYKSEEKMRRQQILIGGLFLNTVLRGDLYTEKSVFSAAKKYDVTFENAGYQVAVVCTSQSCNAKENYELPELLQNWMEAAGQDVLISWFQQRLVLLFNPEEAHSAQLEELLRCLLDELFPQVSGCAGLGPRYDNMVDIVTSYRKALAALDELEPLPNHPVRCYRPGMDAPPQQDGMALMEEFSRAIYERHYEQARNLRIRLIEEYLHAGIGMELLPLRQAAIKNLLSDGVSVALEGEERAQLLTQIAGWSNTGQIRAGLKEILERLTRPQTTDLEQTVPQRAKRIIDESFTDSMLGLYMISEQVGVSNSYLSTAFKDAFGMGVVQYINQLRIDQAKNLILSTDMSIKDIALTVGFASDISFIRVFKKYEQQTPGTLRKAKTAPCKNAD